MITALLLAQIALPSLLPQTEPDGFKLVGRLHSDWVFVSPGSDSEAAWLAADPAHAPFADGAEIRRAEIGAEGPLGPGLEFKLEIDFASGAAEVTDSYLRFSELPLGSFKVGHMKEPVGLGKIQSSKTMTFIDRPLTAALIPGRNAGFLWEHSDDSLSLAAGLFRNTDDAGDSVGNEGYSFTTRAVFRPIFENGGARILHAGFSYSFRRPDESVSFGSRLESHMLPKFLDTGDLEADSVSLLGAEVIWIDGPLHCIAEHTQAALSHSSGLEPAFRAYSVEAGWVLTGENARYKKSNGSLNGVLPENAAFDSSGQGNGAWQVLLRHSNLDLTEAASLNNELTVTNLGLNWFVNPHSTILMGISRAELSELDATHMLTVRFGYWF